MAKLSKAERDAEKVRKVEEKKAEKERKAEEKRLAAEEKKEEATRKKRLAAGDNSDKMSEAERQQLFLKHNDTWLRLADELKSVKKKQDDAVAAAKNDGFTKKQLERALEMDDPKKDAKIHREVRELLQVAFWKGSPIKTGDLFGAATPEPEATVTDQAYAEGRTASAHGQPRRVPVKYPAPGEAFNAWLAGFDDHQRELQGGVGRGAAGAPPAPVTSGTPVKRSDYEKSLKEGLGGGAGAGGVKDIIEKAGGTPAADPPGESTSERLRREQGIQDDE